MQVNAIKQWPGEAMERAIRPGSPMPASGGVHGRNQQHPRGETNAATSPRNANFITLKRLPKGLQRWPGKLGQFVEKQHAVMGQRDLSWSRSGTTADNGRRRCSVVRAPKGS